MTNVLLLKELITFLNATVDEYAASKTEAGDYVKPRVLEWYVPFKKGVPQKDIDFPYITARISDGADTSEEVSTVNINLFFGIYHENEAIDGLVYPDGAYDLMNLMDHIRIALFRRRTIANKYSIKKPYKWEIPDEQPYPLWVGWATSVWEISVPLQQLNEVGVDIHGNSYRDFL